MTNITVSGMTKRMACNLAYKYSTNARYGLIAHAITFNLTSPIYLTIGDDSVVITKTFCVGENFDNEKFYLTLPLNNIGAWTDILVANLLHYRYAQGRELLNKLIREIPQLYGLIMAQTLFCDHSQVFQLEWDNKFQLIRNFNWNNVYSEAFTSDDINQLYKKVVHDLYPDLPFAWRYDEKSAFVSKVMKRLRGENNG